MAKTFFMTLSTSGDFFQMEAQDDGLPPRSATVTVTLFIIDRNDNAPAILFPLPKNGFAREEIVAHSFRIEYLRHKSGSLGCRQWLQCLAFLSHLSGF